MARRRQVSVYSQIQRERMRQAAAQERSARQAQVAAERAQRAYERAVTQDAKERQRLLVEARMYRVAADNDGLEAGIGGLKGLLTSSLHRPTIKFAALKRQAAVSPFIPGPLAVATPPPDPAAFKPPEPTGLHRHLPKVKQEYLDACEGGRVAYEAAAASHAAGERERQARLAQARQDHEKQAADLEAALIAHNSEVDSLEHDYKAGTSDAILSYCALILDNSPYPSDFPQAFRLAYVPESKQLVVEYELPTFEVIPSVGSYKYTKSSDKVTETPRPLTQRKSLYTDVVAQVTLRTVNEIFGGDEPGYVDTVVFNGHVHSINPGTGQPIHPCLISLRTSRETFKEIDLSQVDPVACLKALNAGVSKSPSELVPVRPVLEFSMVDPRFVEETDVLSGLDQRPNLMELTPNEFENLITNLFQKMGLETRQTRPSRDGGVDCVAYDPRPILGGKVVIQAKRYKNTVGVSAVRDLFGTVHNEGASKGILVATSGYGQASFEFAEGKPLELLSGSNLLYLLSEHAGIEARIEPPEDWVDPVEQ
jgi:restriction system protein